MLRRILALLSLSGLVSLGYLLGAAVVFFDLPSATFLRRAFVGGAAWYVYKGTSTPSEEGVLASPLELDQTRESDHTSKSCDGFTLCMYGNDSYARLVNMRGEVVHQWHAPFSQIWPDPRMRGSIPDTAVAFNSGHIYPNGDLLAVLHGPPTPNNPFHGLGLVKLDKDSHVLWKYDEKCHHDIDVAEDGTIYVLTNEMVWQVPPAFAYLPTPCLIDHVDVLSPEGKRKKRIPLLEALQDSPYAALLGTIEERRIPDKMGPADAKGAFEVRRLFLDDVRRRLKPSHDGPAGVKVPLSLVDDERRRDVLHTNTIKVLSRTLAPKFPMFKAGQLLISLRRLDALAVLDPDSGKVVWAAHGPWHSQHAPSFLDNGHLLLFDNLGSPRGSRVLEYDPQNQAFPWIYTGEKGLPFLSTVQGTCQRLPNGNTLIVNTEGSKVFEVTPAKETVWSCSCIPTQLYSARRYTPEQLPFLKGYYRVRP